MAIGGVAELFLGVRAEQQSLENIAKPLTAEEAEGLPPEPADAAPETEREQRIRERGQRQRARERAGLRRFRPGPGRGTSFYSPGMVGTTGAASRFAAIAGEDLDREIEVLTRALEDHGPIEDSELERLAGGRQWGPGRFRAALREAVEEGRAVSGSRGVHGPPSGSPSPVA
jgi:hypothetical protein